MFSSLITVILDATCLFNGRSRTVGVGYVFIVFEFLKTFALIFYVPSQVMDPAIKENHHIITVPLLCEFFDFQTKKTTVTFM